MSRILLEKGDGLSAIAEGLDVPPGLRLVEVLTDDGAPSKGAVAPELVLAPYAVAQLDRLATKINADAADGRFVRYELFVAPGQAAQRGDANEELVGIYAENAVRGMLPLWPKGKVKVPRLTEAERYVELAVLRVLLDRPLEGKTIDAAMLPDTVTAAGVVRLRTFIENLEAFIVKSLRESAN
jgi:hypothetical protein